MQAFFKELKFNEDGLIPAVAQDVETGENQRGHKTYRK